MMEWPGWKDKYMTDDVDMQVLSTGEFAGEWLNSSSMIDGTYTSFFANEPYLSVWQESEMSQQRQNVDIIMDIDES